MIENDMLWHGSIVLGGLVGVDRQPEVSGEQWVSEYVILWPNGPTKSTKVGLSVETEAWEVLNYMDVPTCPSIRKPLRHLFLWAVRHDGFVTFAMDQQSRILPWRGYMGSLQLTRFQEGSFGSRTSLHVASMETSLERKKPWKFMLHLPHWTTINQIPTFHAHHLPHCGVPRP